MSPVAQRLDFARQAVFLLDRDPLEHLDPLLQGLHLVAKPQGFAAIFALVAAHAAAAVTADPCPNPRPVAQRLDLGGGFDALVRDDLLEDPQPLFDALDVLGILRALLGSE